MQEKAYFGGGRQKIKMEGAGSKVGVILKKKLDFPLFQFKTKIYDPGKVKLKNDPKRVCPNVQQCTIKKKYIPCCKHNIAMGHYH